MFLYICCIEVVSTLIGRLINYITNTETSSDIPMAGRKPEKVAYAQRITKGNLALKSCRPEFSHISLIRLLPKLNRFCQKQGLFQFKKP